MGAERRRRGTGWDMVFFMETLHCERAVLKVLCDERRDRIASQLLLGGVHKRAVLRTEDVLRLGDRSSVLEHNPNLSRRDANGLCCFADLLITLHWMTAVYLGADGGVGFWWLLSIWHLESISSRLRHGSTLSISICRGGFPFSINICLGVGGGLLGVGGGSTFWRRCLWLHIIWWLPGSELAHNIPEDFDNLNGRDKVIIQRLASSELQSLMRVDDLLHPQLVVHCPAF